MTDVGFNQDQERLRQAIIDEIEENGGDALTSTLRDNLFAEFGYREENKSSFQRQLLRMEKKMTENGDVETVEEHSKSSNPEWRWMLP